MRFLAQDIGCISLIIRIFAVVNSQNTSTLSARILTMAVLCLLAVIPLRAQYRECLTHAFNLLRADSIDRAGEEFRRALKLSPDAPGNYVVHRELGKVYMAQGRYPEAVTEFNEVLQRQPADEETRLQRATCHIELQHARQALEDCRTLFQHATDTTTALRILFLQSAAHRLLRQYPQVDEDLQHILRMQPTNTAAQLLYAVNLADMGQPQESLNRLNLYVSAHPQDIEGLTARSRQLLRQHQPILAREDIDQAITLSPLSPELYLLQAEILDEMGKKDLARQARHRAHSLLKP